MNEQAKIFVEEEQKLFTAMVSFVQAAFTREMEEVFLLGDDLKQLELLLLGVVAHFPKSSNVRRWNLAAKLKKKMVLHDLRPRRKSRSLCPCDCLGGGPTWRKQGVEIWDLDGRIQLRDKYLCHKYSSSWAGASPVSRAFDKQVIGLAKSDFQVLSTFEGFTWELLVL
ncbi:unnamed protein product [Calypogeia fissa]